MTSSYRPHPLRQSHTMDIVSTIDRQPSTTSSSASSGYSNSSSTYSRGSSNYTAASSGHPSPNPLQHRRGQSDLGRSFGSSGSNSYELQRSDSRSGNDLYSSMRQSLRPLPQAPTNHRHAARSMTSSPTTATATTTTTTMTNHSAPSTPPYRSHLRHERGQSVDIGKLSLSHNRSRDSMDSSTTPTPTPISRPLPLPRPNSLLLTRSDSISRSIGGGGGGGGSVGGLPHPASTAHVGRPDLELMGRSSTSQLRTLSRLAQSESSDEFSINRPAQEVVGLRGRRRLQRADQENAGRLGARGVGGGGYGWEGRNWMDNQRQFLQAYEYLCHIGEAREWIQDVTRKELPPIVELEQALRDGVTLAELVEALSPDRRYRIFHHHRLQYRHSDNIAIFFRYLDEVELPDLFRFELIDLYEKKNIPKVIYCIHALSWLLLRKGILDIRMGNLVGQLEFEDHELEATQKGLDRLGANMPSFGTMGADFGVEPEPEPEPVETEEERIDRELGENEGSVVGLQAQARGALVRMRLGSAMEGLWDSETWLVHLQARIRGDFARQVFDYKLSMHRSAVAVQSASRGFLVRRRQAGSERVWKRIEPAVVELQSMIRAARARDKVRGIQSQVVRRCGEERVRELQAAFRGHLVRRKFAGQQRETARAAGSVALVQAAARGMLQRRVMQADKALLRAEAAVIKALQAAARAALTRSQVSSQLEHLESFASDWEALQAAARGSQVRGDTRALQAELKSHTAEVTNLQSLIRATAVRREVAETLDAIGEHQDVVLRLQSVARGMLLRQKIMEDQQLLIRQESRIRQLQARTRGYLFRKQNNQFLEQLGSHTTEITMLQTFGRAMLERERVGTLVGELEAEEESIIQAQAAAKAFIVRIQFAEKKRFFNENMQKVVKIQSFVRAKIQGEAYKSLTTGKNPPVNAVKNFVHLLNDSDFDFNEEVEFERMRKTVVQQVRQNEMLEQYIDQLDIKIALLVKNKITLDEVVRHQSNFGGHGFGMLANASMASSNQFDLKALNKSSRKKLESYQQLFFNLQTQPQYLARLFRRMREQGTTEKECKRVELLMMSLFGYAQKRREEYYLLKLIARSIREEIDVCRAPQDFARGNFFWAKLLGNYARSPRDRKYLRDVLGPVIRDNIVEDPALDLESDPIQIYRAAINNEELRTGRPSVRQLDVPREVAIKDPETRELFIDHLRDLREICDQFFAVWEDLMPRMPYGLRFLCRQMFDALCQHFPREPQHQVLFMVSNWLWKFYLQPALTTPETFGVMERQLSPLQRRNLGEVAKVLSQVVSGRLFGGENIYLQPLNAFLADSIDRMSHIMRDLMSVPDAEATFDIDEFNDLYAKNKPTLYVKMADIFAIHNLLAAELPAICPNRDDVLREILQDLGSAKHNESEMAGGAAAAAGGGDIHMFLTPKLHDLEDPEAEVKALFMETKRCVLYIIRVQQGPNLLDILVKPITAENEQRWRALVREDFSGGGATTATTTTTKGAYSDANMVDVTRMSYQQLKRTALENVLRLEQMGRISKQNRYQDILNAIALDIRTKSRRRVQRQRELEGVRLTLGNLHDKAKWLEQQRKSYDDYIESAMVTLQNKKGKKKFLLPFTKQYNHQRELERSGRVPKFGSFKYSVRALAEKGVVVSWSGVAERDWDKINLTISCDEVGVFAIEGSRGHIQIPGASALVPIEDLLQAQFEAKQFMNLFEGNLRLNVNLVLHLVYKKFYRSQ